jgi:hypothetical protein
MTDIVERLRQGVGLAIQEDVVAAEKIMDEAADEIERLREAIQRIDGINDNPAIYNPDIEAVVRGTYKRAVK